MKRTHLKLTDSRFIGLRTHTKNSVAVCPAIRTITTGCLWWRKSKVQVVYAVMLAVEVEGYLETLSSYTDYSWQVVESFESFEMAKNLEKSLLTVDIEK